MANFLLAAGFLVYTAFKKITRKKIPKGARFDWDAYWKDVREGLTTQEQLKKKENLEYWTTKPESPKWYELPLDTVADVERYEQDKALYPKEAERKRKLGAYRQVIRKELYKVDAEAVKASIGKDRIRLRDGRPRN